MRGLQARRRIAYVVRRTAYPMGIGGAEVSSYLILKRLREVGHDVLLVGEVPPHSLEEYTARLAGLDRQVTRDAIQDGYVFTLSDGMRIALTVSSQFHVFYDRLFRRWCPHVVFTHLDGSLEAVTYALDRGISCFHFVRDSEHPYNFGPLMAPWIDTTRLTVVANSHYIKDFLWKVYGVSSAVVYPEPLDCNCGAPAAHQNGTLRVLYVNPHGTKGAAVVLRLVEVMKDCEFHIVEGWSDEHLTPFLKFANVFVHRHQASLCSLYRTSDVLIVPSQRPEAFSRVAVEGLQHGLVVVAAKHTGLIESVSQGGILIDRYSVADEWIEVLKNLLTDHTLVTTYSQRALARFEALYRESPTAVLSNVMTWRNEEEQRSQDGTVTDPDCSPEGHSA